jgi:hypothetical protein
MGGIGKALSGLFKKPKMPKIPKPIPLPDPEGAAEIAARRKKALDKRATGRQGNILTTPGGVYGGSNLAGTGGSTGSR